MRFARRLRELFSTLRFRLVLWNTFVVFLMVLVANIAVRAIQRRALEEGYDQFLRESLKEVQITMDKHDWSDKERLFAELRQQVRANEHRNWFVQLFNADMEPMWSSNNAPPLPNPSFAGDIKGPYDATKHRVFSRKLAKTSGEFYFVRCGFLQLALQQDLDLVSRNILLASISILLAAPLGAYVIALRATRPIAQVIATAAHLQPSNLNERLPIRGTGDEIDRLSMTINGMLDRLASYLGQNRDFVANAAHELRSPLAAIRSAVEVGLNRSRSPEEYAAILTDVVEEIGRLAGLVNQLLILAEGDAGRLAGKNQHARLDKVVHESVDMFEAVAESQGVRLRVAETAPILVPGDETHLRQLVRNLIDNAIKYNGDQGEVTVRLRSDQAGKNAILTVQDTGPGIEPDMLPRIFERFFRADKSRTREKARAGYGLGLSICKSIVHALNGEISAKSEVGQGSTFTVRLPRATDPAALHQSSDKLPLARSPT